MQPMTKPAPHRIPWSEIDDVLLDLDGTLLDLDFDNHFWQVLVPQAWGSTRGLDAAAARALLKPRFDACAGTLAWYSTDYWSRELELDIAALKRSDAHRIRWLPGARDFLALSRERGKRLLLLTNAHPDALAIKHECSGVLEYFDAAYSSHQFGAPKEDARFWRALHDVEPIDYRRSLFADDSPSVLRAARAAGIGHIRAIRRPDSARLVNPHDGFIAVDALADLVNADGAAYPGPR
jgi:HAD superfamily hydrolase (TIGR01509 family)